MEGAYYIRLGERRIWERKCLRDGSLLLGYQCTPHELCVSGAWSEVAAFWTQRRNKATGTRYANQIRIFYESDESTTFVTIARGRLYWCRPAEPVELLECGCRKRRTVSGWRDTDARGHVLAVARLSDGLRVADRFRGTIRRISDRAELASLLAGE
ncbi:hypothetical protein [Salinarimonas sp.]|uniref:hypothetical protein n=1 Tax=Salinarimonas sp. TaxID=2766526 RepID=UPI0032D8D76A